MLLSFRDDDTSFFTKQSELESAYDSVTEGTVSLSVVPFAVPHLEKDVLPCGEGIPFGFVSMAKMREQYLMIPTAALNAFTARNIVIACHENNLDEANLYFPSTLYGDGILSTFLFALVMVGILFLDKIFHISPELISDVRLLFAFIFVNFRVVTMSTAFNATAHVKTSRT